MDIEKYEPKTDLGRKLIELRKGQKVRGEKFLSIDEINMSNVEDVIINLQDELSRLNETHAVTTQKLGEAYKKNNELAEEGARLLSGWAKETEEVERLRWMIDYASNAPDKESMCSILTDALDGVSGAENVKEVRGKRESLSTQFDLANKRIEEYEKYVRIYAQHTPHCASRTWTTNNRRMNCSCGLSEALKALQTITPDEATNERD